MVIGDGQGGAGRLTVEWRCQSYASIHFGTIWVAVLGQEILTTCKIHKQDLNKTIKLNKGILVDI